MQTVPEGARPVRFVGCPPLPETFSIWKKREISLKNLMIPSVLRCAWMQRLPNCLEKSVLLSQPSLGSRSGMIQHRRAMERLRFSWPLNHELANALPK